MLTAENSAIDVSLRRYKKELSTSGGGYILFGIWSAIKVIMSAFIGELSVKKVVDTYEIEPESLMFFGSIYLTLIGIAAVAVVLLHLYVGLGAIRASNGSKKRGYLWVTVVLLIFGIINLLGYGGQIGDLSNFSHDDTTIAAFMVDVTVIIMLVGILRSAKMIKKLTMEKEQGIQGA